VIRARAIPRDVLDRMRSQLERDYAWLLNVHLAEGVLVRWDYEPERFRLGTGANYTPDFRLIDRLGGVTFDEVKGSRRGKNARDSLLRVKVAAELNPMYRFRVVERDRDTGAWQWEVIE
jgi:hypothetical protein